VRLVGSFALAWGAWYFTIGRDSAVGRRYDETYFGPSMTRTTDGRFIPASELGNSDYCGNCHTDIFHQWDASTHHFSSFNDPYYRRVALDVRKRRGGEALKFCAGCHDPLPLVAGEVPAGNLEDWSENAGITCLSCHRMVEIHGHENGSYSLQAPILHPFALTDRPFLHEAHELLVKTTPILHELVLMKPFYRSSDFCTTCHTVRVPKEVNGAASLLVQSEDPRVLNPHHLDSGAAQSPGSCQDCHMPLVPSSDPAARGGLVHSHRFMGGNTAIPTLNRDQDQLEATEHFLSARIASIEIAGLSVLDSSGRASARPRSGDTIDLAVRVQNRGVGHCFPGGTADSNEAWISIEVRDAANAILYSSGSAGPTESLPYGTYVFDVEFVDRSGAPTDRRTTATEAVAIGRSTVLAPNEHRTIHYQSRIPAHARFPLTVSASLNWRKFSPAFSHWTFGDLAVAPPPITVLDHAQVQVPEVTLARRSATAD